MTSVTQQEAKARKLPGSKCYRCGYVNFPATVVCPRCGPGHSEEVKPLELPEVGTVITWTTLQVAPKGFPSPIVHCVADLGEVKIVGTLQGSTEIRTGVKIGVCEDTMERFPFVLHLTH
jgi:uncharacterized OB-fold protein